MANYEASELKSGTKNKTETTLKITMKNFQDEELPHESFVTTRQKNKIRNAFVNNISTD